MARQLSKALDYTDFRNFAGVIEKAMEACKNTNQPVQNHIVEANEMVTIGSDAEREMASYKLSRYACYLIVQNADPAKEIIAQGQTYFAVQTRLQEIQQMDAYNRLSSEEEKRLFLRNEMTKHNTYLHIIALGRHLKTTLCSWYCRYTTLPGSEPNPEECDATKLIVATQPGKKYTSS